MLIKNWYFDDGRPYYSVTIKQFSEIRPKCWRCQINDISKHSEIEKWCSEYCIGNFEIDPRFNSGNPYLSIKIYDDSDATAFYFRWLDDNDCS